MNPQDIFPPLSEREIKGAEIARKTAADGMVLLKNDRHTLPLKNDACIALFGNGAVRTVRGGTGSGDPFNGGLSGGGDEDVDQSPRYHINILPALQAAGMRIVTEDMLNRYAQQYDAAKRGGQWVMQTFSYPDEELNEEGLKPFLEETDTAVYVLSRNSGEGHDRTETDDYKLTQGELNNLELLRDLFSTLILVLNVGGPVSVSDLEKAEADAILLMGLAGQEGGLAVTDILTGRINPSGRLAASWARDYADYPSAGGFLSDPDTSLYNEGIYVGYRYFDTFKLAAGYPFGYGLSYSSFTHTFSGACLDGTDLKVQVSVQNTGDFAGREVVQLYVSAPSTELDMPFQELRDFRKTACLNPGSLETLDFCVPLASLASYSKAHGGYILSKGYYIIRIGRSSAETVPAAAIRIDETRRVVIVDEAMPLVQELEELKGLTGDDLKEAAEGLPLLVPEVLPAVEDRRSPYRNGRVTTYTLDTAYHAALPYENVRLTGARGHFGDLLSGKLREEEFTAQLTDEELASLACGTGWGVADENAPIIGASSESVPGAAGETTHLLEEKYGVPSIVLADGPGGVRITQHFTATNTETGEKQTVYHYCIAWPTGTLLAQSFDPETLYQVGLGLNADLRAFQIAIVLGPGINIQRNPLCGRNFEYFSEDPLLSGVLAAAITRGTQEGGSAGACIKHYACNNQETNRNRNDSVVGQRALREIYLEPYRIAIRDSKPLSIMTSYNKINGVPTADSYDLCTNLARGEWGFDGLIMTDWNGGSSTPSISMHAGNDLIMPGGKTRELNILKALKPLPPAFDERGEVGKIRIVPFAEIYELQWNSFVLAEDGEECAEALLGEGHTAEVKEGQILVDGEPVYTEAASMMDFFKDREHTKPLKTPLTTAVAAVGPEGKSILYKGRTEFHQTITRGDVQARAASNLRVIRSLYAGGLRR